MSNANEREFYIDGIWLRDTVQLQKCQWANKSKEDFGIVIGVDKNQEWMLDWWWNNYFKHNDYPVFFADFGMTQSGLDYCKTKGQISQRIELEDTPWYKKPFGCLHTPFKKTLWLDTDCEVRGNLKPVFDFPAGHEIAATLDRGTPQKWFDALPSDIRMFNSGAIIYNHGEPVIQKWALMTLLMLTLKPVEGKLKIPTGDQEILALAIRQYAPERAKPLPVDLVRLRLEPDKIEYGDCLIKHWTGPVGKDHIRKMYSPSFNQFDSYVSELISYSRWTNGMQIGVGDGKLIEHMLSACPGLNLTVIDEQELLIKEEYKDRLTALRPESVVEVKNSSLDFVLMNDYSESSMNNIREWFSKLNSDGWLIGDNINWTEVRKAVRKYFYERSVPGKEMQGYYRGPGHIWFVCKKYTDIVKDLHNVFMV